MEPTKVALIILILLLGCTPSMALTPNVKPKCDVSKLTHDMSSQQLLEICGKPYMRNIDSYGTEQWVYDMDSYIYIRNGYFSSAQWVVR